jgi:hypothetical protein
MSIINARQRLAAAAIAIGATFSIVWSVAGLAYPQALTAPPLTLAQACR